MRYQHPQVHILPAHFSNTGLNACLCCVPPVFIHAVAGMDVLSAVGDEALDRVVAHEANYRWWSMVHEICSSACSAVAIAGQPDYGVARRRAMSDLNECVTDEY